MEGPEGLEENPYIAPAKRFPKTSSLKQAGWFKKLFKKIKRFFQKVVNAIVKAIQKVTQWITKALTAAFGKMIGGALAGLVNSIINILTFPVHVAYYSLNGDWKGLLKYMGNTALQIAMIAIQFIPGVGQIIGTLFQYLGTFLQWMGQALVFAGNLFGKLLGPALGGLVKGALHFAGGFLEGFGGSLIAQGKNMIQNSKNIFQNLKDQGFKFVTDSLKNGFGNLLKQLNPVTYYKNLYQSVTGSLNQLGVKGSLSKLLDWSKTQFLVNLAQQKIDQKLEKSKMNSFFKAVLSTVSSAGLQGMGSFFREGILSPRETAPAEATRSRAPPTGLAAVIEQIKGAFSSVGGFVTDALKDSAGFIKSLFIREDSSSLSPALQDELLNYTGELGFDSEGNPLFYKPLGLPAQIEYRPTQTGENIRFDLDGGELQFFRRDPSTRFIGPGERVGNIPAPVFQNYLIDPRVGPYDIFPGSNFQSQDPFLNSVFQSTNELNNFSARILNSASNLFGYGDEIINRITGTTPEQRLALALQTQGPSPLFGLDDVLARGELAALKGIAFAQKVFGVDQSAGRAITAAGKVTNPIPIIFARRVPASLARDLEAGIDIRLARPSRSDVYITAGRDVRYLKTNLGASKRLTLLNESGEFLDKPSAIVLFKLPDKTGLASPVFRNDPGFVGYGRTARNAREFVIPNKKLSELGAEVIDILYLRSRRLRRG